MVNATDEFEFVRDTDMEEMAGIGDPVVRQIYAQAHVTSGVEALVDLGGVNETAAFLRGLADQIARGGSVQ